MIVAASTTDKIVKYVGIAVGVGAGMLLLTRYLKNANQGNANKALTNEPEAQQADHLYSLLHPYGNAFEDFFTRIDHAGIVTYAANIKDFNKVASYYSALSRGNDLPTDIRTTLSADERDQFYKNMPSAQAAVSPSFTVVAAPRDAKQNPIPSGKVPGISSLTNPKVLFSFVSGQEIGTTNKKIRVSQNGKLTYMYYVTGTKGASKGQQFYVLLSQVSVKN